MSKLSKNVFEVARLAVLLPVLAIGVNEALSDVTGIQETNEQSTAQQAPHLTKEQKNLASFGMSGL